MNPSKDIGTFDYQDALDILHRRWLIGATLVVLCLFGALVGTLLTKARFTAETIIEYRSRDAQSGLMSQVLPDMFQQPERQLATQAELIVTRPILRKAIKQANAKLTPEALASSVKVAVARQTNLMSISITRPSAKEAAKLANVLAKTFISDSGKAAAASIARVRKEVAYKIIDTEEDIVRLSEKLEKTKNSNGTGVKTAGKSENTESVKETQIKARLQLTTAMYGTLREKHEELRIVEQLASGSLRLAEPASIPSAPVSPNMNLNMMLASVVAFILASAGMLAADRLDNSLKDVEDIQHSLGLPVLGEIPLTSGIKLAAVTSQAGEAFRTLRTNIQFYEMSRPVKTILVTSPSAGDGKTVVAANLGAILAFAGYKVIVVDADLRRPTLHKLFELMNHKGLSTILADLSDGLETTIKPTGVKNLHILPSGPQPPNSSEILQSLGMTELLTRLRETADFVIIDSPPAGLITDATVLARQVDGVLLVVSERITGRELARRVTANLQQVGASLLGVVVNKTTATDAYYHYDSLDEEEMTGKGKPNRSSNSLSHSHTDRPPV